MSMASISSLSTLPSSPDSDRPNPESIKEIVVSVNDYFLDLLANTLSWNSLKSEYKSRLNVARNEFFEFSEHSVLSNLYWGIENIEAAINAKCAEERSARLRNSEKMLQVPALLDEDGVTVGIQNNYLICCSYFYLSVVSKLRNDEWQVALHFLQATLVSPALVRTQFAPELCEVIFSSSTISETSGKPSSSEESVTDFNEENDDEMIRPIARRYKHWLMYYQVVLYGRPQWHCRSGRDNLHLFSKSQLFNNIMAHSSDSSNLEEQGDRLQSDHNLHGKVHSFAPQDIIDDAVRKPNSSGETKDIQVFSKTFKRLDQVSKSKVQDEKLGKCTSIKCIQEILMESQQETSSSISSDDNYFLEEFDSEENMDDVNLLRRTTRTGQVDHQPDFHEQRLQVPCSTLNQKCREMMLHHGTTNVTKEETEETSIQDFSGQFLESICSIDVSILQHKHKKSETSWHHSLGDNLAHIPSPGVPSTGRQNHKFTLMDHYNGAIGKQQCLNNQRTSNEVSMHSAKDSGTEFMTILQKAISKLCFSEGLEKNEEEYTVEITTIYKMLNDKRGIQYTMLKEVILDQLVTAISSAKEEKVIRASVSILATIVSVNKSAVEDIKKKGLQLCNLATALKLNVHEAATLIYLINPSPTEIKTLELLPALVEVVCTSNSYREKPTSLMLTPPVASLMMIEVLVTAFDCATNNMHLAAINSPHVLSRLLDVARSNNLEEYISLANILVKCMQFDGQCRKYALQFIPVAPFISLLQSNQKQAKITALKFFHEILSMPRSSAISILQRIHKEGTTNVMQTLMHCLQNLPLESRLLAANLLLQLDTLENSSSKSAYKEKAMQILLKSLASSDESFGNQQLSASILANIGGTYSWTGEPYTVAWLVKKAGLTSLHHRNMIRNFDWSEQSLQEAGIESWCGKMARGMIEAGKTVFYALAKGLRSNSKRISRDSLTAIACLGCEISKSPYSVRYSACEILMSGVEQFLHPGLDLDERLLACFCVYNYASGRGMQKLIHFSEGVRESLRRFSNVTWMAEELHRVADYYLPNKSRISCVHTQILEASHNSSGAVTALIYYRGLLYSGYSDGSIKVWDIKQQASTLLWDMKEHKKAVTCFSICEAGDSILSGSADKTIRVWQMVKSKLECIEAIAVKEPIRKLETFGQMIVVITQGHGMKVFDSSRSVKDICKAKKVKSMTMAQGKAYLGCMDSSIQELTTANNREREIKAPTKSWVLNKPINSICVYKDWLYSASSVVEGSKVKEWRTNCKPQMTIVPEKGRNVLAMEVVEDFVYLNCSSSTSTLQIWLRAAQQKVGRISAGSRITSLLTVNDVVLCGTEKGLIKGWIPL